MQHFSRAFTMLTIAKPVNCLSLPRNAAKIESELFIRALTLTWGKRKLTQYL